MARPLYSFEEWCPRCETKVNATYTGRGFFYLALSRRSWRWINHRWVCPKCLTVEESPTGVTPVAQATLKPKVRELALTPAP